MIAPEPQAMTLEEGLAAIFPDTIGRRDDGKWPFFTYMNDEHGHTCTAIFDTWPEAVSWAKGVPVVARDGAAELRAALEDARERLRLIFTAPEYGLGIEYMASVAVVGVDKADAALAASEGQS